jgi:enamine deaminase RidA (YjgF/YER057c/UK114 family)
MDHAQQCPFDTKEVRSLLSSLMMEQPGADQRGVDCVTVQRINPGPHWSQVVIHGDVVYLAGQTAADKSQDVKGQTKQVLDKIDALLASAGTDKSKLLTANIWLSDINNWSQMNEVWDAWVAPGNAPTRATVEAKLAAPGLLVEIMVQAAR